MTPPARAQAAIDLLEEIVRSAREGGAAADVLIQRYFKTRRYAGAKDRRAVRELVYAAIRRAGEVPASGRAALVGLAREDAEVAALFDGSAHGPSPIAEDEAGAEAGIAPAWLVAKLTASPVSKERSAPISDAPTRNSKSSPARGGGPRSGSEGCHPLDSATPLRQRSALPPPLAGEDFRGLRAEPESGSPLAALLARAPLDLRVNRLKAMRDEVLPTISDAIPTPYAPDGLRLPEGTRLETLPGFADGLFEVQDEGSQLVASVGGLAPGMDVIDLCAGAGGKTLALAARMAGQGRIVACDTDRGRLRELMPRAERAGAAPMIQTRLLDPGREREQLADLAGLADLVLIDAPCSGTGTWRRNPEARWRLTPDRLARLVTLQARLIETGMALVRPGGSLVYIVCSLLDEEGPDQVRAIRSGWTMVSPALPVGAAAGAGWRLDPASSGTDGFFVAWARRPC